MGVINFDARNICLVDESTRKERRDLIKKEHGYKKRVEEDYSISNEFLGIVDLLGPSGDKDLALYHKIKDFMSYQRDLEIMLGDIQDHFFDEIEELYVDISSMKQHPNAHYECTCGECGMIRSGPCRR